MNRRKVASLSIIKVQTQSNSYQDAPGTLGPYYPDRGGAPALSAKFGPLPLPLPAVRTRSSRHQMLSHSNYDCQPLRTSLSKAANSTLQNAPILVLCQDWKGFLTLKEIYRYLYLRSQHRCLAGTLTLLLWITRPRTRRFRQAARQHHTLP